MYHYNKHYREARLKARILQNRVDEFEEETLQVLKSKETTDFLTRDEQDLIEKCLSMIWQKTVWDISEQEWRIEELGRRFTDDEMGVFVEMLGKLTTRVQRYKGIPIKETWRRVKGKGPIGNQYFTLPKNLVLE